MTTKITKTMSSPTVLACAAILLFACGKPPESPAPTVSSASMTRTAEGSEHEGAEHHGMNHETKHGGVLKMSTVNGVHLHTEIVARPDGRVSLFMTDAKGGPISPSEVSGNLVCERDDTHEKVSQPLKGNASEGSVEAQCAAFSAAQTTVSYDLNVRATALSQSLKVPPAGTSALVEEHHHEGHEH